MTIYDTLRNYGFDRYQRYNGEFGLEIETETKKVYTIPPMNYWISKGDGSLRDNGVEYILRAPLKFEKEIPAALEEFGERTKGIPFIKDSITTSVHVHVNMLNETFLGMGNFLTLYSMFENLLIRFSGPDRLSNLFCLPICDAEDTYKNMITMMRYAEAKSYKGMMMGENSVKYAACNLSSFANFGSIELRSFRGETDVAKILDWIGILYKLLEFSRKDLSPKEILLLWKNNQLDLMTDVFGKAGRKLLAHKDEKKLIEQNIWYAASLAYGIKDWKSLDIPVKIPEFKPKQKELDQRAMSDYGVAFQQLNEVQQQEIIFFLQKAHNTKHGVKTEKFVPPIPQRQARAQPNHPQQMVNEARNIDFGAAIDAALRPQPQPIPEVVVADWDLPAGDVFDNEQFERARRNILGERNVRDNQGGAGR